MHPLRTAAHLTTAPWRVAIVLLLAVLFIAAVPRSARSQSVGNVMAFGFNAGGSKYWGDFSDNQFWYGGDIFLRYNIFPALSINASFGLTQLRYKNTDADFLDHPEYFGPNARIGGTYPNSPIVIEEKNAIRVNTYEAYLSLNFTPGQRLVPYIFGGIGLMNFNPATLIANVPLPNNYFGRYEKTKVIFPVGVGFEVYLNEFLVVNGKGTFRFTGTDILDDFEVSGSTRDAFATFGLGMSYYIFGNSDWDDDGLKNSEEEKLGTDPHNPDTDGDSLADGAEVRTHLTDPLKKDTDADGLTDADEVLRYKTDPLRSDGDNDGVTDGDEVTTYRTDPLKKDSDGDGLADGEEITKNHTDPLKADTDGDTLSDAEEVNIHHTSPLKKDSDGDGLSDGDEIAKSRTDPMKADTDGDGLSDGDEVNSSRTDPLKKDSDVDGLSDGDEVQKHRTNPLKADTDGDTLSDGDELQKHRTDPLKADTDGDTLSDSDEINRTRTDPLKPDTDDDTIMDAEDACPLIKGVRSATKERNGCPEVVKIGTKYDFPDILFIVNTDEFNFAEPATGPSLAKLLAYVNQCPNLQIVIEGHASQEGKEKRNRELSELRAKRVKEWLLQQGVNAGKLLGTIGFGSSKPKVAEPSARDARKMPAADLEALRKQNRRITVVVQRGCE
ncbi:MAG: OmpA family protein [Ignavibacteria bacterium]|nr:OmpA family protein [Ignavibacteria bacterium]